MVLGLWLALVGCGSTDGAAPAGGSATEVTILFQSRVDGEIEPCG